MSTKTVKGLALVLALGIGVFAWPTLYRYESTGHGLGTIRINRITNSAARLTLQGWEQLEERTPAPAIAAAPAPTVAAAPAPSAPAPAAAATPAAATPTATEQPRPASAAKSDQEALSEIDKIMSRKAPGQ